MLHLSPAISYTGLIFTDASYTTIITTIAPNKSIVYIPVAAMRIKLQENPFFRRDIVFYE